jgi:hypothetical protein
MPRHRFYEMSLLQRIVDRLRPVTTIHVDAGELVFQRGTNVARAQPLIRLAEDGKIIEVGQAAAKTEGGRLVRLFAADAGKDDEAILAFCRYHLMLTSNANLLRQRVTIVEPTFRQAFGRHAARALERVLDADGFQVDVPDVS